MCLRCARDALGSCALVHSLPVRVPWGFLFQAFWGFPFFQSSGSALHPTRRTRKKNPSSVGNMASRSRPSKPLRSNPWVAHVRAWRARHGGTYRAALTAAGPSYRAHANFPVTLKVDAKLLPFFNESIYSLNHVFHDISGLMTITITQDSSRSEYLGLWSSENPMELEFHERGRYGRYAFSIFREDIDNGILNVPTMGTMSVKTPLKVTNHTVLEM